MWQASVKASLGALTLAPLARSVLNLQACSLKYCSILLQQTLLQSLSQSQQQPQVVASMPVARPHLQLSIFTFLPILYVHNASNKHVSIWVMLQVRFVQADAIRKQLNGGHIVLLGNLAYSAAGEILNCDSYSVATQAAIDLQADKLFCMTTPSLQPFDLPQWLPISDAQQLLQNLLDTKDKQQHAPIQQSGDSSPQLTTILVCEPALCRRSTFVGVSGRSSMGIMSVLHTSCTLALHLGLTLWCCKCM